MQLRLAHLALEPEQQADSIVVAVASVVLAVTSVLPIVALAHAALRVPGKRAPWDHVAGTIVRYRSGR